MLRTGELNWRDLKTILAHLPPDSAYQRELAGYGWTLQEVLDVQILNTLQVISWQIGGGQGSAPKPLKLPGLEPDNQVTGTPRPVDQVHADLVRLDPRWANVK